MKKLAGGAALSVLTLAMATAAYAQETTSGVRGTVTAGGKPVAGAAVQLVHTPSGTKLTTSTEAGGGFDARGLRVGGPYTITVTGKGMPPRVLNNIFLQVGKTSDVNVDLTGANEVEEVIVTAAGTKDTDQGPKTVLTRQDIQQVVSVSRDPRDLASRDLLVTRDVNSGRGSGVNGGGVSIAGSNPRYNRVAVDGVSAQDQFGLNQGGLTTARGPVNLDAIEQFSVAAVPTDVENGDFVGGALNMVLRSGGNSFHGAIFDNYLNDGLVGTKSETVKIPSNIHQKNYGAFISGPIWKDRLFFAASYENYETVDVTSFGVPGSGAANTFLQNGTQALIDTVTNSLGAYSSKFTPGGISPTTPVLDRKYSVKIDWNIMEGQRASLTYRYAESSNVNRTSLGLTTLQLDSGNYTKFDSDEATTFELHSNWTDRFSTFFKATTRNFQDAQTPPSGQNYSDVRVCSAALSDATAQSCQTGFDQVNFGPDQFRHANALSEKELRFQLTGDYELSNHSLKFGGQARRAQPLDLFVSASHGVYYFDSLADFKAGKASELQYQNSVTGNPTDARFSTTYWTYSGFVQDTYRFSEDLKATAGIRYDRYSYPDSPALNPNFLQRYGYTNQKTIDGQEVFMPRLSMEWKARPNLKISTGVGLFSGGTPDVLTGAPFYNSGYKTTSVDIRRVVDANGNTTGFTEANLTPGFTNAIGSTALDNLNTDPKFGYAIPTVVQQLQQGTLPGAAPQISPLGAVIALSPSFKMPSQWKFFGSAQMDLWDGWRLQSDLVVMQVGEDLTFYDARAQQLTINGVKQTLPDGRLRYDGLSTTAVIAGRTSTNGGNNNDLIIADSKKGSSYTATIGVSKSWDWGGDFSIGYAKSNLRDLTPGLFFGTTSGSLYNSTPALGDPNHDYLGRSVYEISNRYKAEFGFHKKFFGDNETRIALFAERQDGRPYSFTMSDLTSGRGPVFGVTKTGQALYVPDLSNVVGLKAGLVYFATQADLDRFKRYATNFGLSQGLQTKYSHDNAAINRVDLSLSQQLPTLIEGHKIRIQADVRNVLNLLNPHYGRVAEYSDTGLVRVQCADANGVAQSSSSAVCTNYRYSNVLTSVTKQTNQVLSLWYAQISLRYEF